jgi:carboxyl-terminal processing protease
MKDGNVLLEQDSKGNRTPYPVNGSPLDTSSPLVVLVNGNSASAAEIVSGSLKDNHRATLIGTKTFGTGTVLQQFKLSDGSALLLGTSEWLTPNGNFIRDNGITPNMVVQIGAQQAELTPNVENESKLTEKQILAAGDTQLNAAINFLNKTK